MTAVFPTQGGGTAVEQNGQLVWHEPPDWMTEAKRGDPIPEEWSVVGPYDDKTGDYVGSP